MSNAMENKYKQLNALGATLPSHCLYNSECMNDGIWKSFVNLNTGRNNLKHRAMRFINEPGYYTRNCKMDKLNFLITYVFMIVIIISIIIMWYYNANRMYALKHRTSYKNKIDMIDNLCSTYNKKEPNTAKWEAHKKELLNLIDIHNAQDLADSKSIDKINSFASTGATQIVKFISATTVASYLLWSVYKRTTTYCFK